MHDPTVQDSVSGVLLVSAAAVGPVKSAAAMLHRPATLLCSSSFFGVILSADARSARLFVVRQLKLSRTIFQQCPDET